MLASGPVKSYNGRPTLYLWFCVLLGGCGGLLLGYDNGVTVGPASLSPLLSLRFRHVFGFSCRSVTRQHNLTVCTGCREES